MALVQWCQRFGTYSVCAGLMRGWSGAYANCNNPAQPDQLRTPTLISHHGSLIHLSRFIWIHNLSHYSYAYIFGFASKSLLVNLTMSILLASLGNVFGRKPVASASAHVSDGTDIKWTSVTNPRQALLQELQQIYWNGVRRELIEIIFTLKTWQHADFDKVALSDETDQEIYGFDTFLDQVIESSRDFALHYCEHYVFVPRLQHC